MWFTIGEFAHLSRVSARMLQHYDHVGILKPMHTDVSTGDRYYSSDQLPRLQRICALRDLAFTLDDIALLLADDESAIDVQQLLRRKQQELHQRIADDQARVYRIEMRLRAFEQEHPVEADNTHDLLTTILREQYGITARQVERLYGTSMYQCYQVADATGGRWDAYVIRADGLADTVYTPWLSGYGGYALPDFQLSHAGMLVHLETQQYPAQRLRRTQNADVVGYRAGWSVLLASSLLPLTGQPTVTLLRGLGAALGRLHTLTTQVRAAQSLPIGQGWCYPAQALREARHYLEAARPHIPSAWHSLVRSFSTAMQTIQYADVPQTLTHGDPLLAKAVQTEDGTVTLREWHSGGLGVAILDVGRVLLACHWNPDDTWPYRITPNPERIAAILHGYATYRAFTAPEREVLQEAIQYSIGYGSAEHIAPVRTTGWTTKLEQTLVTRKQWFEVSMEIAQIAQTYLRSER